MQCLYDITIAWSSDTINKLSRRHNVALATSRLAMLSVFTIALLYDVTTMNRKLSLISKYFYPAIGMKYKILLNACQFEFDCINTLLKILLCNIFLMSASVAARIRV